MRNAILISLLTLGLFACGHGKLDVNTSPPPIVMPNPEPPRSLTSVHYFEEVGDDQVSGALAIMIDYYGLYDVSQIEVFRSKNYDGTYSTHPTIAMNNLSVIGEKTLIEALDVNYTAFNDLKEDGGTIDLGVGKRYTVYTITINQDDLIIFTIQIHDGASNINGGIDNIVIERVFKEIK